MNSTVRLLKAMRILFIFGVVPFIVYNIYIARRAYTSLIVLICFSANMATKGCSVLAIDRTVAINQDRRPSQQELLNHLHEHNILSIISNPHRATAQNYKVKDSRGLGMDCMKVLHSPIPGSSVTRYLAVYHSRNKLSNMYEVHLAQSLDLLVWEHVRILITNADMPDFYVDDATGSVLLVYERFLSTRELIPCVIGVRKYDTVQKMISGLHTTSFDAPSTLSNIEGTPSIFTWDAQSARATIWFHFHNHSTKRDMVAQGILTEFPGDPQWNTSYDEQYVQKLTALGATGNIGGRDILRLNTTRNGRLIEEEYVLQEGNVQAPPLWPTNFSMWRLWLYSVQNSSFTEIAMSTHKRSTSFGNPSVAYLPCPTNTGLRKKEFPSDRKSDNGSQISGHEAHGNPGALARSDTECCSELSPPFCLVITCFVFHEGTIDGSESGQLLYYYSF